MKKLLCLLLAVILSLGLLPGSVLAAETENAPDAAANAHEYRRVIFNANGGAGSMDTLVVDLGHTVTLPKNTFTRENYTFLCWNTQADGSGTSYADGSSLTVEGNITLYAQWKGVVTISAKNVTVARGKLLKLTASVKVGGMPCQGQTVRFTFRGKTYSAKTNSQGIAQVRIKTAAIKAGKYKYSVKFSGKTISRSARITGKTTITAKKAAVKKGQTLTLTVTVKEDGKPLKKESVQFTVRGATYTKKTNAKGIAVLKLKTKKMSKGTYTYKVRCNGKSISAKFRIK